VARLARHARLRRMHPVAEVDELRQPVHSSPRNRLPRFRRARQLLNMRTLRLHRLVTAHAKGLSRKPHRLARIRILMARVALPLQSSKNEGTSTRSPGEVPSCHITEIPRPTAAAESHQSAQVTARDPRIPRRCQGTIYSGPSGS
jgi:hypothetical protein